MEEVKELLDKYKIEYKEINHIYNCDYRVILSDDTSITVRMLDDKFKIAREYKYALQLAGRVPVRKIFKKDDLGIPEAAIFVDVDGRAPLDSIEEKNIAYELGETLGMLHISELNEQVGEDSLRKAWRDYILSKIVEYARVIKGYVEDDVYEKILEFFERNATYVQVLEDEMSIIHGNYKPENVLIKDGRVVALINFDEAIVGDRVLDFATMANIYGDDLEASDAFFNGYDSLLSLPAAFNEKLLFYRVFCALREMATNIDDEDLFEMNFDILSELIVKAEEFIKE